MCACLFARHALLSQNPCVSLRQRHLVCGEELLFGRRAMSVSAATVLRNMYAAIRDVEALFGAPVIEAVRSAMRDVLQLAQPILAMRMEIEADAEGGSATAVAAIDEQLAAIDEQLAAERAELAALREELRAAAATEHILRDLHYERNGEFVQYVHRGDSGGYVVMYTNSPVLADG